MTSAHGDQLVADYLARLNAALAAVPGDRREEIVGEISSHIAEERAKLAGESDADVLNLLDRIGAPADLAAAAGEPPAVPAPARTWGALEVCALIFTPLIWPVGVILLWLSPAWRVRDKLIGTLLPPFGYPGVLVLGTVFTFANAGGCTTVSDETGRVISQSCTGIEALPQWEQTVIHLGAALGIVVLLVLPIVVMIYLATRLNRGRNAPGPAQNGSRHAAAAAGSERSAAVP